MKKFYICNEAAAERNAVYFDFDGKFEHVLGVTYIQETGGDPRTSEELDVSLEELIGKAISEITECDAADEDYITGLCEAWGADLMVRICPGRDLGFDGYTETSKGVICVF